MTMRETVRAAMQNANDVFYARSDGTIMKDGPEGYWENQADAAIRDVIEALATEAITRHGELIIHGIPDMMGDLTYDEGMVDGYMVAAFLRGHIGDTEAQPATRVPYPNSPQGRIVIGQDQRIADDFEVRPVQVEISDTEATE